MAMRGVVRDLVGVFRAKGGPGSGHRGHSGRPGSVGGSTPGTVGISTVQASKIASAIKRMIPYDNRKDLDIPTTGLPDAHAKLSGRQIETIAYNPTTNSLLVGGGGTIHADLVVKYAPGVVYDDYVKVVYAWDVRRILIDVARVTARDAADAWNKGFSTADALVRAGFPKDMTVKLWIGKRGKRKVHEMTIGDMVKEFDGGWVMESTLGALVKMRHGSLTLRWKGGPGSGHRGHAGRPGQVGGSVPEAGIVAGDWRAYGNAPVPRPSREYVKRFLRGKGDVELYHITYMDYISSIKSDGLIPAREEAMGQDWKAPHSRYATYFYSNRGAAMGAYKTIEKHTPGVAAIVKATLPRTMETAARILPDEDVSLNVNDGLKALLGGDSVAIIGGVYPDNISIEWPKK